MLKDCYMKIIHILHPRCHQKIIDILKNKQKNKCLYSWDYIVDYNENEDENGK